MDLRRPSTTTEARVLIEMLDYYKDMWPRRSHILAPLKEAASSPKGRNILWNYALEISFKELKRMVSGENLLNYLDWTIKFAVHTDTFDKDLGFVISQNNKHISFSVVV